MNLYTTSFQTPFGEFSAAVDEHSNIVATAFGDLAALKNRMARVSNRHALPRAGRVENAAVERLSCRRRLGDAASARQTPYDPVRTAADRSLTFIPDEKRTTEIRTQVLAYCRGDRRTFDLPLRPAGTPFQQRVWTQLARIPRGTTRSYADIARAIGSSPRAVGRANATNPICLVVPCHRVIGADGSLTGFAFGEPLKQRLLDFEAAPPATKRG